MSHDIDLMMPFTRNKSSKRSETSQVAAFSKEEEEHSKEDDEVEFERALSSVDGKSPREYHNPNDENLNINANL